MTTRYFPEAGLNGTGETFCIGNLRVTKPSVPLDSSRDNDSLKQRPTLWRFKTPSNRSSSQKIISLRSFPRSVVYCVDNAPWRVVRRIEPLIRTGGPSSLRRYGVDYFSDLRDHCCRKTASLCMLMDKCLTIGKVDAKCLVSRHVAVFPLNVFRFGSHVSEYSVGFLSRRTQRVVLG